MCEEQKTFWGRGLLTTILVVLFGWYIIKKYDITLDMFQQVAEEVDGFKQIVSFVSDPGVFFARLQENPAFTKIFTPDNNPLVAYMALSMCIAWYLSNFLYLFCHYDELPEKYGIIGKVLEWLLELVNGIFIGFISNYILLMIFEKIPQFPLAIYNLCHFFTMGVIAQWNVEIIPFGNIEMGIIITVIARLAIIAVSIAVLFGIWAILIGVIVLTLLETLVITALAMLFDITAWPPYLPIMITALIRILLNHFFTAADRG